MAGIKSLMLDLETFSSVDLSKCGVYRYASSADFDILLFGFSVDGGNVQVIDLACGEEIPSAHGSSRGAGAVRWCGRLTLAFRGHWRM